MGHDISLQLREHNLMTKIMLKQEDEIINHIRKSKLDITQPINQIGDTIMHYAAYNALKVLMEYLLELEADCHLRNTRGLSAIDVALPETREWLIRRDITVREERESQCKSLRSKASNLIESTIIRKHMTSQQLKHSK